nr:DNA cytosine methyltransferase [Burkholderia cenocepacia]
MRNLIAAGHIAPGDVDERSIEDVQPDDLRGYAQCHFFAGIGVWSYALRRAGWPDDRPVWTGSCPCQPFSAAGKGGGFDDERHLWPHWHWLIAERRPAVVFGEQVASSAVEQWIDLVQTDVEALDYAYGCVPFPSAGVGSPHIRDRAYWMAYAARERRARIGGHRQNRIAEHRETGRLAHADRMRGGRHSGAVLGAEASLDRARLEDGREPDGSRDGCAIVGLADTDGGACRQGRAVDGGRDSRSDALARAGSGGSGLPDGFERIEPAGPTNGFWRAADWLLCRDGKWRPVEPSTFPLVDGAPARVGRLRAYGNAVNGEATTTFILAARAAIGDYELC